MYQSKLIILRGNSGSGKSSTAFELRQALLDLDKNRKIAVIEQDYLRRKILKQPDVDGNDSIELIQKTAEYCLERDYDVIIEGILFSERYSPMLRALTEQTQKHFIYYFDVSFEETLRRHENKPNAHEFGKKKCANGIKTKTC